jgi:hypothetical protein
MQKNFLSKLIKSLMIVALFASCAKSGYDDSLRPRPLNNLPQVGQQGRDGRDGGNIGTGGGDSSQPNSNLPVISFTTYQVLMDNKLEARLE